MTITVTVVCAIIIHNNKILAAKRSLNMPHPGYWEFPGGKIEEGENDIECLHREIMEELNCEIIVEKRIQNFECNFKDKKIVLLPFICKLKNNYPSAIEHDRIEWLSLQELNKHQWLPTDIEIINFLSTFFH